MWRKSVSYTVLILLFGLVACSRRDTANTPGDGIFPPPASLVSVTIVAPIKTVNVGSVLELIANGQYSDQTSQKLLLGVSWTSSATDIATVDNTGRVKGIKPGQAVITATKESFVASVTIETIPVVLQTVQIQPPDSSIFVGNTKQFTAVGVFNDGTQRNLTPIEVFWSSSDSKIATINDQGVATSTAEGTITIKAVTVPELGSIMGTATLRVQVPTLRVINVASNLSSPSMATSTTQQFTATGTYDNGQTKDITSNVVWGTNNSNVATVGNGTTDKGLVTAVGTGTALISATLSGISGFAQLVVEAASFESLSVFPENNNPTMVIGTTRPFKAIALFNNDTQQDVTGQASWSSSNSNIATVDDGADKGKVKALVSGAATITAFLNGKSGQSALTVINGILQTISVTPADSSMAKGTTRQLTATGTYDTGFTIDLTALVTWTFSGAAVTINSTGLATGSNEGTSTITATLGTVSGTTSLTVSPATLLSILVTPGTPFIYSDEEIQFMATGVYNDNTTQDITSNVTWTSFALTIATITSSGEAIGVATGTSLITASFANISGTTTLMVKSGTLNGLTIIPTDPFIPSGGAQSLQAIGTFTDGGIENLTKTVSWSSTSPSVATVSNLGIVKGLSTGITMIKAQKNIGGSVTSTTTVLTVTKAQLMGISITPNNASIPVGIRKQYTALAQFDDGSALDITSLAIWGTSSTSAATVNGTGLVTAMATTTTTGIKITATYEEMTGTATLIVNNATINSILVTPASSTLGVGLTRQYKAEAQYNDGNGYDVTLYPDTLFLSANTSIVAITPSGLATGMNAPEQTTTIVARFGGAEGSTIVTVKNLLLTAINVTPTNASVPSGGTLQYTATGVYGDGSTENLTASVNWSVTSHLTATVEGGTGFLTGKSPGSTTLFAAFGTLAVGQTDLTVGSAAAKEVSAGGGHTCAVRTDLTLRCWGKNFSGQIGNDQFNNVLVAESVKGGGAIVGVASGGDHTCSVLSNGQARCWGSNQKGQLGNGTFTDTGFPTNVPNLGGVKTITTGLSHTCVILGNNAVKCWGDNASGQLGNGTNSISNTPVIVSPAFIPASITAGLAHTCVLSSTTDGSVQCWGDNSSGQLGTGFFEDSNIPVSVMALGGPAIAISAGGNHTCALLVGGIVQCWGDNQFGQLGGGVTVTVASSTTPVTAISGATGIAAGESHTCAIVNNKPKCWGKNSSGQLGDATKIDRNTPTDVSGFSLDTVVGLTAGGLHTCAILQGGNTQCWGSNKFGQLGNNVRPISKTPVGIPNLSTVTDLDGGREHTCVVTGGTLQCMGGNRSGQLGNGTTVGTDQGVNVGGITTATSTDLGALYTCVLLSGGTVQCWGDNSSGQLGNGSNVGTSTPVFSTGITTASKISAGEVHTCAVQNGTLSCWGGNSDGQLGNGSQNNANTPGLVIGLPTTATTISVTTGDRHTCALLSDNTVWCWGKNDQGQLGSGSIATNSISPQEVTGLTAIAIAAGRDHTCALLSSGTVQCWGSNASGQLGNETTGNFSTTPVGVTDLGTTTAIAAGGEHTCALLSDRTVQCWGRNSEGQLGIGTEDDSDIPVPVNGITTAVSISAGVFHTCARLSSGAVQCWGDALFGQLGSGFDVPQPTPVPVQGL